MNLEATARRNGPCLDLQLVLALAVFLVGVIQMRLREEGSVRHGSEAWSVDACPPESPSVWEQASRVVMAARGQRETMQGLGTYLQHW